jgi:hypothetical protein
LVDDKIAVDLKVKDRFYREDVRQIYGYLDESKKKLGIFFAMTRRRVKFERVILPENNIRYSKKIVICEG